MAASGKLSSPCFANARTTVRSVKVGFVKAEYDTAVEVLQAARHALEGSETKLIGSLFADNHLYDGLDPHLT